MSSSAVEANLRDFLSLLSVEKEEVELLVLSDGWDPPPFDPLMIALSSVGLKVLV